MPGQGGGTTSDTEDRVNELTLGDSITLWLPSGLALYGLHASPVGGEISSSRIFNKFRRAYSGLTCRLRQHLPARA